MGRSRRTFLKIAGATLGAGGLACAGAGYLATREPAVAFREFNCGKELEMSDRILIAYASKCGSTGEVAEAVAKTFCDAGAAVDVKRIQDVKDLRPYRAAVIGTAIRMSKPLPEAVSLAKKIRAQKISIPVALFSCGLAMKTDTPENRAKAESFLAPILEQAPARVGLGLFGGKLDYQTLSPLFRWAFSQDKTGQMAEGDWRDWNAIRAWAESIRPLM